MGKDSNSQQYRVVRTTPIVRLGFGSEVVFLQSGNFYDASGKTYDEATLPGWVKGEMSKLSDDSLKSVGFTRPNAKPSEQPAGAQNWQCPDCGKIMDERNKEPHIAKHRKHSDVTTSTDPKKE